jgi:hypothetical protein
MEWLLLMLGALFVAGMVDWRRPLSLRTLDALALTAGFGAAFAFFDRAQPLVATPWPCRRARRLRSPHPRRALA